ncbi:hypothetical protein T492DRAFT_1071077 [Pavlovales sp. CCMP2436]|nr:hypothetical protein T492DRAFT_1071077 [Pavlovales sp. CCMP2436]
MGRPRGRSRGRPRESARPRARLCADGCAGERASSALRAGAGRCAAQRARRASGRGGAPPRAPAPRAGLAAVRRETVAAACVSGHALGEHARAVHGYARRRAAVRQRARKASPLSDRGAHRLAQPPGNQGRVRSEAAASGTRGRAPCGGSARNRSARPIAGSCSARGRCRRVGVSIIKPLRVPAKIWPCSIAEVRLSPKKRGQSSSCRAASRGHSHAY